MNYYIINNKIYVFENEFDASLYDYPKLSQEQSAFYELHKCSLNEVLNLTLNVPYVATIDEVKASQINHFSNRAFELREIICPEYKLINASLGIYSEIESANIKRIVEEFRAEFYRLKTLVESATTIQEIETITDNYSGIE